MPKYALFFVDTIKMSTCQLSECQNDYFVQIKLCKPPAVIIVWQNIIAM